MELINDKMALLDKICIGDFKQRCTRGTNKIKKKR